MATNLRRCTWNYGGRHGRPQGRAKRAFVPPWKLGLGTKFLVKLVALFGLFDFIFAIIVHLPLILTVQKSQV